MSTSNISANQLSAANPVLSSKNQKIAMSTTGIVISCLLFIIPLGLIYNFVYQGTQGGIVPNFFVFLLSYLLGFVANLLFYRMIISNDMSGQINQIQYNTVLYIMGLTLCGFTVLLLTLFALAVAPTLVTIFENTFGYWFVGIMGLSDLTKRIFESPTLDPYIQGIGHEYPSFDYNFLITRINNENVDAVIDVMRQNLENNRRSTNNETVKDTISSKLFQLDFRVIGNPKEDGDRLKYFVKLKRTFGHFMWTYFASIISLMISMVAVIIGSS